MAGRLQAPSSPAAFSRFVSGSAGKHQVTTIQHMPASTIQLSGHSGHVNLAVFSPSGERLYTLGFSGELFEWSTTSWEQLRRLEGHRKSVNALQFSADGQRMYSGSTDGLLIEWDRESGEIRSKIDEFKKGIHQLQYLPLRQLLALSTPRQEILLFDPAAQRPVNAFAPRGKRKGLFAIDPTEEKAVIAEFTGNLVVTSLPELQVRQEIKISDQAIMGCRFLDENRLLTVDYTGILRLLDLSDATITASVELDGKDYYFISLSPSGKWLAVSHSHRLHFFEAATLKECINLELEPKGNYGSSFSPADRWFALGSADKKARVWSLQDLLVK